MKELNMQAWIWTSSGKKVEVEICLKSTVYPKQWMSEIQTTVKRRIPNVQFDKPNTIVFGFQMVRILDVRFINLEPNVWFGFFSAKLDHFIYIYKFIYTYNGLD